jgi:hypothetical protein
MAGPLQSHWRLRYDFSAFYPPLLPHHASMAMIAALQKQTDGPQGR